MQQAQQRVDSRPAPGQGTVTESHLTEVTNKLRSEFAGVNDKLASFRSEQRQESQRLAAELRKLKADISHAKFESQSGAEAMQQRREAEKKRIMNSLDELRENLDRLKRDLSKKVGGVWTFSVVLCRY